MSSQSIRSSRHMRRSAPYHRPQRALNRDLISLPPPSTTVSSLSRNTTSFNTAPSSLGDNRAYSRTALVDVSRSDRRSETPSRSSDVQRFPVSQVGSQDPYDGEDESSDSEEETDNDIDGSPTHSSYHDRRPSYQVYEADHHYIGPALEMSDPLVPSRMNLEEMVRNGMAKIEKRLEDMQIDQRASEARLVKRLEGLERQNDIPISSPVTISSPATIANPVTISSPVIEQQHHASIESHGGSATSIPMTYPGPARQRRHARFKVQRKSNEFNKFMKNIRKRLDTLMGLPDDDREVIDTTIRMAAFDRKIDPADKARFLREWALRAHYSIPRCCTAVDFRIDLTSTPRSPWNSSAAEVFTDDYITYHGITDNATNRANIKDAFFVRVKSILAEARIWRGGNLNVALSKRDKRRIQRRLNLFKRRYKTLLAHPLLRPHIKMLEALGPGGMSDDESDREDDQSPLNEDYRKDQYLPSFDVILPAWRAVAVTEWLIAIDTLYVKFLRADKVRGSFPHVRRRSYHYVDGWAKCVKGLPLNAYDSAWLEGKDRAQIGIVNEIYNFGLNVGEIMPLA